MCLLLMKHFSVRSKSLTNLSSPLLIKHSKTLEMIEVPTASLRCLLSSLLCISSASDNGSGPFTAELKVEVANYVSKLMACSDVLQAMECMSI